jgi:hypothetical protein
MIEGFMSQSLTPRISRVAVGMAVLGAFVVLPFAAQAADTNATGTLSAGSLSNTAPVIAPFTATLTGDNQTVNAQVGSWSVTDATGNVHSYTVNVSAGAPTINGTSVASSLGSTWLTLTPTQAVAAANNPAPQTTAPVPATAQALGATAATIDSAAASTGAGEWDFTGDSGAAANLAVVIPGNAAVGAYSDTLTFTTAPGA